VVERKRMKKVWSERYKVAKKQVRAKKGVTPLELSDRHSARMALRYVISSELNELHTEIFIE
jgi:hypothetical protein